MRAISIVTYTLFIVGILIYTFSRAHAFLFGPTLEVHFPKPHQQIPQVFTLTGTTHNATHLSINDQRIYPDENGLFEKNLVLPAGYTIVKLYARNRQKREQIIYLPLYIQPHDTKKENSGKKDNQKVTDKNKE